VVIPADWIPMEAEAALTRFRSDEQTQLVISIGDESGKVTVCNFDTCHEVHAHNAHDLGRDLDVFPDGIWMNGEGTRDTTLDGRPAFLKGPFRSHFLMGPPTYVHAYALLGRRPVVLRFNYDYLHQEVPTSSQAHMIETFQLRADRQLPLANYVSARDGYEIAVPAAWTAYARSSDLFPGRTTFDALSRTVSTAP
jgi:hypothetical protein